VRACRGRFGAVDFDTIAPDTIAPDTIALDAIALDAIALDAIALDTIASVPIPGAATAPAGRCGSRRTERDLANARSRSRQ
jgi:hypothetical protein